MDLVFKVKVFPGVCRGVSRTEFLPAWRWPGRSLTLSLTGLAGRGADPVLLQYLCRFGDRCSGGQGQAAPEGPSLARF